MSQAILSESPAGGVGNPGQAALRARGRTRSSGSMRRACSCRPTEVDEICGVVPHFCALSADREHARSAAPVCVRGAGWVVQTRSGSWAPGGRPWFVLLSSTRIAVRTGRCAGMTDTSSISPRAEDGGLPAAGLPGSGAAEHRLNKLDALKDALIPGRHHELKTPVAKHAMQLELLRGFLGPMSEEVGDTLLAMDSSIRRQEQVISNLLNLAPGAGGKKFFIAPQRWMNSSRRWSRLPASSSKRATSTCAVDVGR